MAGSTTPTPDAPAPDVPAPDAPARTALRVLVLGGTRFVGRAIVEAALARGHTLTLFTRGTSNPALFPQVEHVHGDRTVSLDALGARTWDVVIDTCGYLPRVVDLSARTLAPRAARTLFISTISVYVAPDEHGTREDASLATLDDPTVEAITGETYGGLKVLCERAVTQHWGARATIVRPGLVVGPHDPTDRFTYWPMRIARGGDVLVPQPRERRVQFIDARDLAAFVVRLIEQDTPGTFNAIGPRPECTMQQLLDACVAVTGSDVRMQWADEAALAAQGVQPWTDLPLWIPSTDPWGRRVFDASRAFDAGLRCRTVEATVRDTWQWARTRPADHRWAAGLEPRRERAVLDALSGRA